MPETKKDQSVGKRQQIHKSGRVMFAWVAGASVVAGFAIVSAGFLIQRIMFESKVTMEKRSTVQVLKENNEAVNKLRDEVRVLNTNAALSSARLNESEEPLRVILDSLPADNNPLALGASAQQLVTRVNGVSLESFRVGDDSGVSSEATDSEPKNSSTGAKHIPFTMTISSNSVDALKEVLKNFEKSIRVIDIDSMTIERGEDKATMTVSGHGYYLPEKTIGLTKKEVKP